MGRFIVGGYSTDITFGLVDEVCRAVQNAVLTNLAAGKGFFFRNSGEVEGTHRLYVVWISPTSAVRFEYDGDVVPDLNEGLAASFNKHVEQIGGIIIPSKNEVDSWTPESAESEAAQP